MMLALGLAACDSQTAVNDELADETIDFLATSLSQDLSLSSAQELNLRGVMEDHAHDMKEPGFLWYVAAAMQDTLSDEQKQRLFDLVDQWSGNGRLGKPKHGGPGGNGHHGGGLGLIEDLLTDDQKAALEDLRSQHRSEIEALIQAKRDGSISDEDFKDQMSAIRDAVKSEIDALLTDEQKAALEERQEEHKAEREALREERLAAIRAAMADALGLTADQVTTFEELWASQQAAREDIRAQIEDGSLTKEEAADALAALHETEQQAIEAILDETQYEIYLIHEALALRMRHRGFKGGRGGGPGGPGGSRG